jgi:NH3-dependent NAD+ synthetase
MQTPTFFGGSALLHLIAAHPKVVALFGIAATVSLLMAPHGPGRYLGTDTHLRRIEAAVRPQERTSEARQRFAEGAATQMLARRDKQAIATAVRQTLSRCGHGCTDISTEDVTADEVLLRRVLVLYHLDREARGIVTGDSRQ